MGHRPRRDGVDLSGIHRETIRHEDVPEVFHRVFVECALLHFCKEFVLMETVEHLGPAQLSRCMSRPEWR